MRLYSLLMDLTKNKSRIGFDATQFIFVFTNLIFRLFKFPIPMFSRQTIQSGGLQHQSWECLGAVERLCKISITINVSSVYFTKPGILKQGV